MNHRFAKDFVGNREPSPVGRVYEMYDATGSQPDAMRKRNKGTKPVINTMLVLTASYELRQVAGANWHAGLTGEALRAEGNGSDDGDG